MLEAIERFRVLFGVRPLFVTLAVLALLLLFDRVLSRKTETNWTRAAVRTVEIAGTAALLVYIATLIWYALDQHFFDNAEPSVIAIGWLFHLGQPIYHLPESAERYSHIYGPLAFIIHGAALGTLGPSILISKALSAIAAALGILLTFLAVRRQVPAWPALTLAGVEALLLMAFRNFSYWPRPEPFQLLAVAASLLIAAAGHGIGAAIGVGLASGVLWNLKLTGPLYSVPIFVLLQRRAGWHACTIAAAVGAITATLPFILFENVSLPNYLYWFRLSAKTGLLLSTLKQNLEWALYFGVPLLVAYLARPVPAGGGLGEGGLAPRSFGEKGLAPRSFSAKGLAPRSFSAKGLAPRSFSEGGWLRIATTLAASMAALAITAAKPGAGPYHFMPFLPTIAYLVAWRTSAFDARGTVEPLVPRLVIAFVTAAVVVALVQQVTFVATMIERRTRDEAADIEPFARAHQGAIAMGYGATEAFSLARPLLVFRNGSYLIDQPAIREHQLEGVELPAATLDALARCRIKYWLIPKGEPPFVGRNAYAAVFFRPIFPDAFRDTFHAAYAKTGSTEYYDVWECAEPR
jgi:hypothetical protein